MNNLQWIGVVILACLLLIMLVGCSAYSLEYNRGEHTDPVVLYPVVAGTCGGPTTDWPCMEATGCHS